jgi:hypothetical protein
MPFPGCHFLCFVSVAGPISSTTSYTAPETTTVTAIAIHRPRLNGAVQVQRSTMQQLDYTASTKTYEIDFSNHNYLVR